MSGLIFHLIAHTHWDREWYLPRATFHARLVSMLDDLIDRLQADAGFRTVLLDGQTAVRAGRRADPVGGVAHSQSPARHRRRGTPRRTPGRAVHSRCVWPPRGSPDACARVRSEIRRPVARSGGGAWTGTRFLPLARPRRPGHPALASPAGRVRDRRRSA